MLQAATGNLLPLANLRGKELLRAVCAAAASGLITPLKALLKRGEVDVHANFGHANGLTSGGALFPGSSRYGEYT